MESKSLRIGNYILIEETIHVVNELMEFGVFTTHLKGKTTTTYLHPYMNAKPIPLIKKWLTDLGWVWMEKGTYKGYYKPFNNMTQSFRIVYREDNYYYQVNNFFSVKIGYVHVLQNIFYNLTTEEAILKRLKQ